MRKDFEILDRRVVESTNGDAPIQVYFNPDEAERKHLVEDLQVDEHTLASALDPDELARLEFEPNHVAIIFKRPRSYSGEDQLLFKVSSVGMFVFKDRLVIVQPENVSLFDTKLFTRIGSLNEVFLKMIHRSVFHFLEHLKIINLVCDDIERKITAAMENRYLLHLFEMEKSMVYYMNSIHTNAGLTEKLRNSAVKIGLSPEEVEFLDDLIIENSQCFKQAEINSNILASLMDARASIVANNLNILMKYLNIITIGIMVPTLVVSAFSMNVKLPFLDQNGPVAFWVILGLAIISVVAFYVFWKRKKW
jgi:magnesium transporter